MSEVSTNTTGLKEGIWEQERVPFRLQLHH